MFYGIYNRSFSIILTITASVWYGRSSDAADVVHDPYSFWSSHIGQLVATVATVALLVDYTYGRYRYRYFNAIIFLFIYIKVWYDSVYVRVSTITAI